MLCASVYLTVRLSIEPLEQDPSFTALFIQSPWQSLGNDAEEREGSRKEGTEDTKARQMGLECVSKSLVSPDLWKALYFLAFITCQGPEQNPPSSRDTVLQTV